MEENKEVESLEEKSKWGGVRPNSGRPLGSTNKATRDKKEAEKYIKERIIKSVDNIINSQMNLAQGIQMLYRITTNEKGIKSKPELITNQFEIEQYLSGELEDEKNEYYFITTERPDNRALDSLLDRTFGKSRQNIGVDGGDIDKPIRLLNYVRNNIGNDKDTEDEEEDSGDTGGNVGE